MNDFFERQCFTLPRAEIGYLRFITEAYEGLLFVRTLDAAAGLVEVAWPPSRTEDALALLAALARETGLTPAPTPPPGCYPEL